MNLWNATVRHPSGSITSRLVSATTEARARMIAAQSERVGITAVLGVRQVTTSYVPVAQPAL